MRRTFLDAIEHAIVDEMARDERVYFMGTDPPPTIANAFGSDRVRRSPISEAAMTGMAVGAAACGMRPIVWWRNITFSFVAFDQVANQAAKLRYMSGGQRAFPIVFRAHGAGGIQLAAQHSQSPYAIFAQLPGIKVVAPSTPADAAGLLKSAVRDDNPVVFFEASRLDDMEGDVPEGEEGLVPLGVAKTVQSGSDVTIVAVAYMVHVALQAAEQLARDGVSVEIIDLRTVVPLDTNAVRASVRKTGRLVVVDEAAPTCSIAAEIAALVAEDRGSLQALRAPVRRVSGYPAPVPYSPPLEDFVLPSRSRVVAAVLDVVR